MLPGEHGRHPAGGAVPRGDLEKYPGVRSAFVQPRLPLQDFEGAISFVILHPGYVPTDLTARRGNTSTDESVLGMLKAIQSTDETVALRFVSYNAELIL